MYCATPVAYTETSVYIGPSGVVEYCASQNATPEWVRQLEHLSTAHVVDPNNVEERSFRYRYRSMEQF